MANIKLNTRFGELSIDPSKVITFPNGIPGFEKNTKWALFHEVSEDGKPVNGVVVHLLSLDDGNVSLPLTDPSLFGFSYEIELSDSDTAELKLEDPNDTLVLATLSDNNSAPHSAVTLPAANIYANISAPILINMKSQIGMQKLLIGKKAKVKFATELVM